MNTPKKELVELGCSPEGCGVERCSKEELNGRRRLRSNPVIDYCMPYSVGYNVMIPKLYAVVCLVVSGTIPSPC